MNGTHCLFWGTTSSIFQSYHLSAALSSLSILLLFLLFFALHSLRSPYAFDSVYLLSHSSCPSLFSTLWILFANSYTFSTLPEQVTHCLFDKTGTLTTDQLVPAGVIGKHDPAVMPVHRAESEAAAVLAACHALVHVEGAGERVTTSNRHQPLPPPLPPPAPQASTFFCSCSAVNLGPLHAMTRLAIVVSCSARSLF